jgi:hypothetical protein
VTDFMLLNRATLQVKEGYKLNRVRMIDLSVLCDRFYPIEQGYITGERGVRIEQGSDDRLSVLCDRFHPIEQGYIIDERGVQIEHGWDDGPICSM